MNIQMAKVFLKQYFIPHPLNDYHPHLLRRGYLKFYTFLIVGVKLLVIISLFFYPHVLFPSAITSNTIIYLTNKARKERNLPPLRANPVLTRAAQLKAEDMLKKGYFAHQSPEGKSPWDWLIKEGYYYLVAGENLALDFNQAEDVVEAWLSSPSHRKNLLNSEYQEIGIGIAQGRFQGRYTTLVVQFLGTPLTLETALNQKTPSLEKGYSLGGVLSLSDKDPYFKIATNYILFSHKFFQAFLLFLTILLFFKIFIRIQVQHRPTILNTIFLIFLVSLMIVI